MLQAGSVDGAVRNVRRCTVLVFFTDSTGDRSANDASISEGRRISICSTSCLAYRCLCTIFVWESGRGKELPRLLQCRYWDDITDEGKHGSDRTVWCMCSQRRKYVIYKSKLAIYNPSQPEFDYTDASQRTIYSSRRGTYCAFSTPESYPRLFIRCTALTLTYEVVFSAMDR